MWLNFKKMCYQDISGNLKMYKEIQKLCLIKCLE